MTTVTRFAPSPTGFLHLGHAFSALFAADSARRENGRFLLRIENIDAVRCRPEFEAALIEDLSWLGLSWDQPPRRQSEHFADYRASLARLSALGVTYPCFCTRRDIEAEILQSGQAPHGPEGPLYPGICRHLTEGQRAERIRAGTPYAIRLDQAKASALTGRLYWHDRAAGEIEAQPALIGDAVLARKDVPTSYHLSVVTDDSLQRVTLVTRGLDLFHATHLHRLLQALLGYETPAYHHHGLLTDAQGRRLAKRDKALTIRSLRKAGATPAEVRAMASSTEQASASQR